MKTLLLITSIFISLVSFGQTPLLYDSATTILHQKASEMHAEGIVFWKCDSLLSGELFENHKSDIGLSTDDSMNLIKTWNDSITLLTHKKYQQYFKGLEVEYSVYTEHLLDSHVFISSGIFCENMAGETNPGITEAVALDSAKSFIGNGRTFAWDDDSMEYYIKLDTFWGDTTYYPSGELLWANKGDTMIKLSEYVLAYKFNIYVIDSPANRYIVYVNATNGQIVKYESTFIHGTAPHLYYGTVNIDTKWLGFPQSKHFLEANDIHRNIKTKDNNLFKSWETKHLPSDNDDNWDAFHQNALSAHYSVQEAYSYWFYEHQRRGMNNEGASGELRLFIDPSSEGAYYFNTTKNEDVIYLGGFNLGFCASLEVAGHEYTHGVDNYTANLRPKWEAGAIKESYGDIFGLMTDIWVNGFSNWDIFDLESNEVVRRMNDPNAYSVWDPQNCLPDNYPEYYKESDAYYKTSEDCDDGGVHHNASIQNLCFYYLSVGAVNVGPNSDITVEGISLTKAAKIAAFALTILNKSTTNFEQNRVHWVTAARLLYGDCSFEEKQTCRAWAAVNVGVGECDCELVEYPPVEECEVNVLPDISEIPTSISDIINTYNNDISIFPNPTSNSVSIDFSKFNAYQLNDINTIEVININGKTLKMEVPQITPNYPKYDLNLSDLAAGTYTIIIYEGEKKHYKKLIKY